MKISKIKLLDFAAKEIKNFCEQNKDKGCDNCLIGKEYVACPFKTSRLPYEWEFENKPETKTLKTRGW